jgi:S-layer protein (TIGR01564 family)
VSKAISTIGPFSIGQAITGIPNLTVANIEAKISVSNSSYTIAGINNITATPSVSQATTPVLLKNLSTTPIAVLDSNANPGSTLILVGSGYVNSLSKQLQSSYNISITPTSAPIVEAYGTNRILVAGYTAAQTTQAANTFISDLYAAAASSSS